jgi:hypothetical protein
VIELDVAALQARIMSLRTKYNTLQAAFNNFTNRYNTLNTIIRTLNGQNAQIYRDIQGLLALSCYNNSGCGNFCFCLLAKTSNVLGIWADFIKSDAVTDFLKSDTVIFL